jgi:hypothetical protein
MTLSLDTSLLDIDAWEADLSMTGDWLYALWGIRPGVSSPRSSRVTAPPCTAASAGWLHALWGFAV